MNYLKVTICVHYCLHTLEKHPNSICDRQTQPSAPICQLLNVFKEEIKQELLIHSVSLDDRCADYRSIQFPVAVISSSPLHPAFISLWLYVSDVHPAALKIQCHSSGFQKMVDVLKSFIKTEKKSHCCHVLHPVLNLNKLHVSWLLLYFGFFWFNAFSICLKRLLSPKYFRDDHSLFSHIHTTFTNCDTDLWVWMVRMLHVFQGWINTTMSLTIVN